MIYKFHKWWKDQRKYPCKYCNHIVEQHEVKRQTLHHEDAVIGRTSLQFCKQCDCAVRFYLEYFTEADEQLLWRMLIQQPEFQYGKVELTPTDAKRLIEECKGSHAL